MKISFHDSKLERLAHDERRCQKALGARRSSLFLFRLAQLEAAECLEDLRYASGHWHELKGDRKGEWACDLDQPYRLVFTPQESPIPSDEHGRYLWIEIKGVEIVEIVNYHGK